MTVSVIVPAYNIAPFIERCIKSILSQTYKDLQLIVVDDGSTDGTGEICDIISQTDSRMLVLHKKNGGVSSARNAALQLATGKYISFIDGDDWIEPTLYEDAVNALKEHNAQCFMFEYAIDYANGEAHKHQVDLSKYGVINGEQAFQYSIGPENRFLWPKVYEKALAEGLLFNEQIILGEDTLYICDVIRRATKVVYSCNIYYHYFQRDGSAIQSSFNKKKLSGIVAYQKVVEIAENNKMSEAIVVAKEALSNLAVQLAKRVLEAPKYPEHKQDLKYLKSIIVENKKELIASKSASRKTKIKLFIASFSIRLIKWL